MDSFGTALNLLTYPQLQNFLRVEFARARRYGYPLSCLALQVDRLDHLRDLYGSQSKGEILHRAIQVIHAQSRVSDAVGISGDRVIVLLPHTDEDGARLIAERIVEKMGCVAFEVFGREINVTVSIGIGTYVEGDSIFYDAALKQAEDAMMRVFNTGGNGIECLRYPIDDEDPIGPIA